MKGIPCLTLPPRFWLTVSLFAGARGQPSDPCAEGKTVPEQRVGSSPDDMFCDTSKNQSPGNTQEALKTHHNNPELNLIPDGQDMLNACHALQVNAGEGNPLRPDSRIRMNRQFHVHSPGENEARSTQFPLQTRFACGEIKGTQAAMALLSGKGKVTPPSAQLRQQIPSRVGRSAGLSIPVDIRVLLSGQINDNHISGAVTTLPGGEGIVWTALISMSAERIRQFLLVIHYASNGFFTCFAFCFS